MKTLLDQRVKMIRDLMDYYGLKDWLIRIKKGRKYARKFFIGRCCYNLKVLSFSRTCLMNLVEDEILDTALHEIAHALVKAGKHHGVEWQAKARELGVAPKATKQVHFWTDNAYGYGKRI